VGLEILVETQAAGRLWRCRCLLSKSGIAKEGDHPSSAGTTAASLKNVFSLLSLYAFINSVKAQ
jgi:hypothetical protein